MNNDPKDPKAAVAETPPEPGLPEIAALVEEKVITMRRKHLPLLLVIILISVTCVGTSGIYTGMAATQKKADKEVDDAKASFTHQLDDANKKHDLTMTQLTLDSASMRKSLDAQSQALSAQATAMEVLNKKLDARAKIGDRTLATAQKALVQSQETAVKTDKLAIDQTKVLPQIVDLSNKTTVVEKKLDAIVPAAPEAPAKGWGWWGKGH